MSKKLLIDEYGCYRTKNGLAVRILTVDSRRKHPVIALIALNDGTEVILEYSSSGILSKKHKMENALSKSNLNLEKGTIYDKWKINTPILVLSNENPDTLVKRYFAGVSNDGRPMAWEGENTTRSNSIRHIWDWAKLYI